MSRQDPGTCFEIVRVRNDRFHYARTCAEWSKKLEAQVPDATRLLGTCPIAVLGSTETSGVAWRCQSEHGASEVWHTLPERKPLYLSQYWVQSSRRDSNPAAQADDDCLCQANGPGDRAKLPAHFRIDKKRNRGVQCQRT